jgi:hypothetical protein
LINEEEYKKKIKNNKFLTPRFDLIKKKSLKIKKEKFSKDKNNRNSNKINADDQGNEIITMKLDNEERISTPPSPPLIKKKKSSRYAKNGQPGSLSLFEGEVEENADSNAEMYFRGSFKELLHLDNDDEFINPRQSFVPIMPKMDEEYVPLNPEEEEKLSKKPFIMKGERKIFLWDFS